MLGDDTVARIYSGSHPSLRAACVELGIAWEGSQPGIHQNNATIEGLKSDVLVGARYEDIALNLDVTGQVNTWSMIWTSS